MYVYIDIADVAEWSRALDIRLSDWCCSVSTSLNPVEGRIKICQLKDLILTLLGLIFSGIYTCTTCPFAIKSSSQSCLPYKWSKERYLLNGNVSQ